MGRLLLWLTTWFAQRKWGQWLLFFFASAAWAFVQRFVTFLGVMLVSNEIGIDSLLPYVSGPLLGMPAPFPQLLALTKIDKAVTVLLSAVVVVMLSKIRIARRPGSPGWSTSPGAS
jgi:hypothetical protein